MEARPITHPSPGSLEALALGKLDDVSADSVLGHLEACPECSQKVAAVSGDGFLNRLRQAHGLSSTPAPVKSFPGPAREPKAVGWPSTSPPIGGKTLGQQALTGPNIIFDLPPALVDHPQYEVIRELGRGGMGVVYLARNKLMDRLEVLKVVNNTYLERSGSLERFLREIQSAAKLSHPNVVTAYSALQQPELLAFAMEYIAGDDLAKVVKAKGPLPIANACYYMQQAAMGLQHAFEKGMVHRDIKPQNLILSIEGKKHIVKILDFGLAKAKREKGEELELTGEGQMLGTPDYIAPEQSLDAANADIRADIYGLGCTLYFLLSGAAPFKGKNLYEILRAHHLDEARALNLVRPDVPEELAAVAAKMMAKDAANRYQKPVEVAQALAPFVKPGAKAEHARSQAPPVPKDMSASPSGKARSVPPTLIEAPAPVWDTLIENDPDSPKPKSGARPRKRSATTKPTGKKWWLIGAGIATAVMLIGLVGLLASGAFKVKVQTKQGILVVAVNEPNSEVFVDGEKVTVTWGKDGKKAEISLAPGTRKVQVKKDGFTVFGEEVEIEDGKRRILTARLNQVPPDEKEKEPRADRDGYVTLFNGKDLTGWTVDGGDPKQWSVKDAVISASSPGSHKRTYLLSDANYTDFTLRFEFQLGDARTHGGAALRAVPGEEVPMTESRFLFDHPIIKLTNMNRESKDSTGASHWLRNAAPFTLPISKPDIVVGKWHKSEVTVRGDACTASFDGKPAVDIKLDPKAPTRRNFLPGLKRAKGRIGFQMNTGNLQFRDIEIKELPKSRVAADPPPVVLVRSDFAKDDAEGWTTAGIDGETDFTGSISIPNSGSQYWLGATRAAGKGVWYWVAPKKYHGDHADKFGKLLTFAMYTGQPVAFADAPADPFIQIKGKDHAIFLTGKDLRPLLNQYRWSLYDVKLDSTIAWKRRTADGHELATNDEIRGVLADVKELLIRGEATTKARSGNFDEVRFGAEKK